MVMIAPASAAVAPTSSAKQWGLWIAFAALIGVVLLPPADGLPVAGQYMLGVLLFAVILWMTEAVDYAVSAVIIAALMAFLLGLAPNAAKPAELLGTSSALTLALGGFANTALALVAAALFIETGDRLLIAVAEHLGAAVRKTTDAVARLSGDEFAILQTGLNDSQAALSLARKLLHSVSQPFVLEGRKVQTAASIGIAMYPADGELPEDLLRNADKAMYLAKSRGGGNCQLYDPALCK